MQRIPNWWKGIKLDNTERDAKRKCLAGIKKQMTDLGRIAGESYELKNSILIKVNQGRFIEKLQVEKDILNVLSSLNTTHNIQDEISKCTSPRVKDVIQSKGSFLNKMASKYVTSI